ncbi:hypothetical protein K6Q96_21675 [Grimontia kaedaensis]|uniref:Uncharacterized protein n=1 Tax=Grimontia kaedaensis TaxID=2872157 RepID=A0ABY4WZE6_9GAMM|nr:hypothetical protein [Grimontia kaedaensis]USH04349.1 hypothetical protein K6Q96_21675 [Grimontia kaedaensis]
MQFTLRQATESGMGFLFGLSALTMRKYLEHVAMLTSREKDEGRIR